MPAQPPFQHTIHRLSDVTVDVTFIGYMSADANEHKKEIEAIFTSSQVPQRLCFTAGELMGFHRDQLIAYVDLFSRNAKKIAGIAIVKARPVVHFGSITLSLMTKMPIKNFESYDEAHRWLSSLPAAKHNAASAGG